MLYSLRGYGGGPWPGLGLEWPSSRGLREPKGIEKLLRLNILLHMIVNRPVKTKARTAVGDDRRIVKYYEEVKLLLAHRLMLPAAFTSKGDKKY